MEYEGRINKGDWANVANRVISVYLGEALGNAWTLAELFGISDFTSVASPNYGGRTVLDVSSTWTRRYRCVWSEYDQVWARAYCTEYDKWTEDNRVYYYDRVTNAEVVKSKNKSGTKYSSDYFNSSAIDSKAKSNFGVGTVSRDIVGDHTVEYNGQTVITLSEDF